VFGKRDVEPPHAATSLKNVADLAGRSAIVLMYDVAYSWKAGKCPVKPAAFTFIGQSVNADDKTIDDVHAALQAAFDLPIILSRTDTSSNLAKGKLKETSSLSAANGSSACHPKSDSVSPCAQQGSACVCEPSSDALVPSNVDQTPVGSTSTSVASRSYNLPEGVGLDDAVIFYIGAESLGLSNLLMTHSSTPVSVLHP
jgi:hypothetical protein